MPLPIMLAHKLVRGLSETAPRRTSVDYLRPDGKSQVTVEYDGDAPVRIDAIVALDAAQPDGHAGHHPRRPDRARHQRRSIPAEMMDKNTKIYVNPTGRFVIGGPHGDAGVTGRKIIVDTYGGAAPHGGGAFSGKDPTKVDRSACYMARYIAKNVVAAGLAERAMVQLAYAIGVADPVSVLVDTDGTGTHRRREDRPSSCARTSSSRRAASSSRSTCAGRSTARPRRSGTSAAPSRSSPGSARTRPRRSAPTPASSLRAPCVGCCAPSSATAAAPGRRRDLPRPDAAAAGAATSATPLPATSVAGAYHVHTTRSDGSGTLDEIAAAAARAGLHFVILTDHGDGTRPPDPPVYRARRPRASTPSRSARTAATSSRST